MKLFSLRVMHTFITWDLTHDVLGACDECVGVGVCEIHRNTHCSVAAEDAFHMRFWFRKWTAIIYHFLDSNAVPWYEDAFLSVFFSILQRNLEYAFEFHRCRATAENELQRKKLSKCHKWIRNWDRWASAWNLSSDGKFNLSHAFLSHVQLNKRWTNFD